MPATLNPFNPRRLYISLKWLLITQHILLFSLESSKNVHISRYSFEFSINNPNKFQRMEETRARRAGIRANEEMKMLALELELEEETSGGAGKKVGQGEGGTGLEKVAVLAKAVKLQLQLGETAEISDLLPAAAEVMEESDEEGKSEAEKSEEGEESEANDDDHNKIKRKARQKQTKKQTKKWNQLFFIPRRALDPASGVSVTTGRALKREFFLTCARPAGPVEKLSTKPLDFPLTPALGCVYSL